MAQFSFNMAVVKGILVLGICMAGGVVSEAVAGDVQLAWDTVSDSRVGLYQVHYGEASGQYQSQVPATSPGVAVTGLEPGHTYYFAARACTQDASNCSAFSNEVSTTVPYPTPVAAMRASVVVGTAPLAVNFADQSSGQITGWNWNFGDGASASIQSPQHTYTTPGTYSVTLSVTGPGGTSTVTRNALVQVQWPAPVAEFGASTRSGIAPLTVTFSDLSSGQVASRSWTFGDGGASTATTAVYTYRVPGIYTVSLQTTGPGGTDTEVKTAFIEVKSPAPVADFTGNGLKGPAPLAVTFQNTSTGQFSTANWSFGDGTTSSQTNPSHSYTKPGSYTVTLTVSGAGGTDTETRSAYVQVDGPQVPLEVAEVQVNHQWQRVNFKTPFADPIVVVKPLSNKDGQPAVVRVKGIDTKGFSIRVQEWDYLDGVHAYETASYLVMERGRHQLPDGAWVEAGRLTTTLTSTFGGQTSLTSQTFSTAFTAVPVVFAAVTSANEADAVDTRLRSITKTGFQVGMREQELNQQSHMNETIDYIACEPSFGVVNGLRYEVGLTDTGVSSTRYPLVYRSVYLHSPRFLADMQTTANADTANLRWTNRTEVSLDLWVAEEQSKDVDIANPEESVGYFVADQDQ